MRHAVGTWVDVERLLSEEPGGAVLRVPRGWLPHPRLHGMRRTLGFPQGQSADFARVVGAGSLRVERHARHDLVWIDAPAPEEGQGPSRCPSLSAQPVSAAVGLGALLGAALGRSSSAVLAGAALAGALAAIAARRTTGLDRPAAPALSSDP